MLLLLLQFSECVYFFFVQFKKAECMNKQTLNCEISFKFFLFVRLRLVLVVVIPTFIHYKGTQHVYIHIWDRIMWNWILGIIFNIYIYLLYCLAIEFARFLIKVYLPRKSGRSKENESISYQNSNLSLRENLRFIKEKMGEQKFAQMRIFSLQYQNINEWRKEIQEKKKRFFFKGVFRIFFSS